MSKLVYERPVLIQHQMGLMNKFGHARANQAMTHIDGVAVSDLLAEYGSPLFVFSERTLVDRYREMRDAFARRWNKVRIAWSYKTNYLGAICRTFHREGAWAEIVSEFEFEKALSLGVHPSQIHFNGPHKNERVLERVLPAGT
ncbi:MAG: diaminopimelate decarboxylase, partial [Myxococcota bacterium]